MREKPQDLSEITRRYLEEAERIAESVADNSADKPKARRIAEYARQIRGYLNGADEQSRSAVEHAILFAVSTENLTTETLWQKPVDDYIERTERIRKSDTITRDDLLAAEHKHPTREAQAQHLGISVRHLRRLRNRLLA